MNPTNFTYDALHTHDTYNTSNNIHFSHVSRMRMLKFDVLTCIVRSVCIEFPNIRQVLSWVMKRIATSCKNLLKFIYWKFIGKFHDLAEYLAILKNYCKLFYSIPVIPVQYLEDGQHQKLKLDPNWNYLRHVCDYKP